MGKGADTRATILGEAISLARSFIGERRDTLAGARAFSIPRHTGVELHRAIVTGLDEDRARDACLAFRAGGGFCIIFGKEAMARQLEDAERVRKLAAQAVARRETRLPPRR